MHVTVYDTNHGNISRHETVRSLGQSIYEVAFNWLCDDNRNAINGGCPNGPLSFRYSNYSYIMVSAWTMGRQWFYVITVFSNTIITDDDMMKIVAEEGKTYGFLNEKPQENLWNTTFIQNN